MSQRRIKTAQPWAPLPVQGDVQSSKKVMTCSTIPMAAAGSSVASCSNVLTKSDSIPMEADAKGGRVPIKDG